MTPTLCHDSEDFTGYTKIGLKTDRSRQDSPGWLRLLNITVNSWTKTVNHSERSLIKTFVMEDVAG